MVWHTQPNVRQGVTLARRLSSHSNCAPAGSRAPGSSHWTLTQNSLKCVLHVESLSPQDVTEWSYAGLSAH